jgi:hypothetical protein
MYLCYVLTFLQIIGLEVGGDLDEVILMIIHIGQSVLKNFLCEPIIKMSDFYLDLHVDLPLASYVVLQGSDQHDLLE